MSKIKNIEFYGGSEMSMKARPNEQLQRLMVPDVAVIINRLSTRRC